LDGTGYYGIWASEYGYMIRLGNARTVFLSADRTSRVVGHTAHLHPQPGKMYIAGIDLAGEAEQVENGYGEPERPPHLNLLPRRGKETSKGEFVIPVQTGIQNPVSSRASGLPIGSGVDNPDSATISRLKYQPHIRIVAHYRWTGVRHTDLYPQLVDLLKNVWHCRRIVVDATGIGQPVASFLRQSIGHAVVPFTFTAASKSTLGFNLLAAINSGHLKMYAGDGSAKRASPTPYKMIPRVGWC
jgi:hypothetical protein